MAAPFVAAVVLGCGSGQANSPRAKVTPGEIKTSRGAAPEDPDQKLRGQFHAAAFQLDGALDHLNDAVADLKPRTAGESGDTKDALLNIIKTFDAAGRLLSDYTDTPELADVRRARGEMDARRRKAIDALNGVLDRVREAQSTLDDLISSGPPANVAAALQNANDEGDGATEGLSEAVRQLGGKPSPAPEASSASQLTP